MGTFQAPIKSLYRELTLAIIAAIALVAIVVSLLDYVYAVRRQTAQFDSAVTRYERDFQQLFELPLWNVDDTLVQKIGSAITTNKDLEFVIIRDETQRIIYQYANDAGAVLRRDIIITHEGHIVGSAEIGLPLQPYEEENQRLILASIGGALFLIVILFVVMRWVLSKRLKKPVDDLIGSLNEVVEGHYRQLETRGMYEEFLPIVTGINAMSAVVANREERLRKKSDELERYFSSSLDLLCIADTDGLFRKLNREWEHTLGYSLAELKGRPFIDLVHPDDRDATLEALSTLSAQTPVLNCINRCQHKDGSYRSIEWRAYPSGRDITERKRAEADLVRYKEHLEEEVRQRTRDLVQAREAAEAASQAKSDFLANMSHEIRTPLNATLGMLYLAMRQNLSPSVHNYVSKAQGAAQSLLALINDILDMSRIEAGKLPIEQVEFSFEHVLEQVSNALSLQAESKHLELLVRYDPAIPPFLIGDPHRLEQVLLNLCSNAIKFTEAGEVELSVKLQGVTETAVIVQVSVRDTGIGMAPEVQAKLFQKFSQADVSSTRRFGGSGLGLAISKLLMELMGGRLWLAGSQPGKGSLFCGTIPFLLASRVQVHNRLLLEQAGSFLHGIRVLVVDDNAAAREIYAEMLQFFDMEVRLASSGAEALAILKQTALDPPFDVVLMDWSMPGMNGGETIRCIRADPTLPQPKHIIMVTAYGRESVLRLVEQVGVDTILAKPVSPSSLLDTVMELLKRDRMAGRRYLHQARMRTSTGLDFGGARVLLVEDNELNREFAHEWLLGMHLVVDDAVDGHEAVAKASQGHYDLVLMDVQMPGMNGLEATRRIRALATQPGLERLASLPIIAMTAMAMAEDEASTRQAGMTSHIAKPVDPEQLAVTLTKWLPAGQRPPRARLTADSWGMAPSAFLDVTPRVDTASATSRPDSPEGLSRLQAEKAHAYYTTALSHLHQLIRESDLEAWEVYCHDLKGVSGVLGASSLFACVTELYGLVLQGQMPEPAHIDDLHHWLQVAIAENERRGPIGAA